MLSLALLLTMTSPPQNQPLTDAQISAKLQGVPAFVVANAEGKPVTAQGPDGKPLLGVFLGRKEADAFAKRIQAQPGMAGVATKLTALGALATQKVNIAYVPIASELPLALKVQQKEKPDAKQFTGIPAYYLVDSKGAYVTVTTRGVPQVPIFFSHAEAEALRVQASTSAVGKAELKVSTLESLLQVFKTAPAKETDALVFIAHKEALEDAKRLSPPPAGGGNPR